MQLQWMARGLVSPYGRFANATLLARRGPAFEPSLSSECATITLKTNTTTGTGVHRSPRRAGESLRCTLGQLGLSSSMPAQLFPVFFSRRVAAQRHSDHRSDALRGVCMEVKNSASKCITANVVCVSQFPVVLWRAPHPLREPTSRLTCQKRHFGTARLGHAECAAGGFKYACRNVWRLHNALLNATLSLTFSLGIPAIRWDRFVSAAGRATGSVDRFHEIHPPASMFAGWVNLLGNVLLSLSVV